MDEKIKIEICCGNACLGRGGRALLNLDNQLPPALQARVIISEQGCLGECSASGMLTLPCVRIEGEKMHDANVKKIIAKLEKILGAHA